MKKKYGGAHYDEKRIAILRRLVMLGKPMTFMDIGYLCGPETVRTMAVHGFIDVQITLKPKGLEAWENHQLLLKKREVAKLRKAKKRLEDEYVADAQKRWEAA